MAGNYQVRVTLQAASNIAADNASNTYCFYTPIPTEPFDNVLDMVEDLYCTVAPGSAGAIGSYLNSSIKRQAIIRVYNFEDPAPRAPVAERFITLPTTLGAHVSMPGEVALCVSFQGAQVSGVPQARRRGRVYIGPLAVPSGPQVNPPGALRTSLLAQFQELKNASDASLSWQWRVFSPSNNNSVLVDNGWIDNAWDTQRRRGPRATDRQIFD